MTTTLAAPAATFPNAAAFVRDHVDRPLGVALIGRGRPSFAGGPNQLRIVGAIGGENGFATRVSAIHAMQDAGVPSLLFRLGPDTFVPVETGKRLNGSRGILANYREIEMAMAGGIEVPVLHAKGATTLLGAKPRISNRWAIVGAATLLAAPVIAAVVSAATSQNPGE